MTRAAVRRPSGRRHGRSARRIARGTRGARARLGARSSNHAGCHDCAARGTVVLVGRARLFAEPNSRGTAGATGHRALRPMTRAAVRRPSGRRHGRSARRIARGTRGARARLGARSSNHAGCHDCAARGTVVLVGRARLFAEPNSRGTAGATGHRALRPMTRAAVRRPSGRRHGRPQGGSPVAPAAPARASGRVLPTRTISARSSRRPRARPRPCGSGRPCRRARRG